MNTPLCALALSLFTSGVLAQARPPVSSFTTGNPGLRLVERSDSYETGSFARWVGSIQLRGKLAIEFDRAPPGEAEPQSGGAAYFEPNGESVKELPAPTNYYVALPTRIELGKTAMDVLPALVGRRKALEVVLSKVPRYEVPVSITLTSFRTDVECDHRNFAMTYSSLRLLRQELLAKAEGNGIGC